MSSRKDLGKQVFNTCILFTKVKKSLVFLFPCWRTRPYWRLFAFECNSSLGRWPGQNFDSQGLWKVPSALTRGCSALRGSDHCFWDCTETLLCGKAQSEANGQDRRMYPLSLKISMDPMICYLENQTTHEHLSTLVVFALAPYVTLAAISLSLESTWEEGERGNI